MSNIYAKEECLRTWNANSDVARHDYFSPHKLEDLHDAYFRGLMFRFSVGDIIYVKDPDGRRAELEVLSLDDEAKTIQFGLIRKIEVTPISESGHAIEERRTGLAHKWVIIGPNGETVYDEIIGEKRARQLLEEIEEEHAAKAADLARDAEAVPVEYEVATEQRAAVADKTAVQSPKARAKGRIKASERV